MSLGTPVVHNPDKLPTFRLSELTPLQGDLKDLSKHNYNKLKNSILKYGFKYPIFVWRSTDGVNYILDGTQRTKVLKKEAWDIDIPALTVEADNERDAAAQLLHITSGYGKATQEGFDEFVQRFQLSDIEVEDIEIRDIFAEKRERADIVEDTPPDIDMISQPTSKEGEIYQLGEHRLMCGDSTDEAAVAKLMNGEKADMVFTDPPYNHGSEDKGVAASVSKAHKDLMNSEWDKGFNFLDVAGTIDAFRKDNCTVYICTSHHLFGQIQDWMKVRSNHASYCVWSKPNPMPSLMKRHWTWSAELICYATYGKHTFNFPESGHALSVWEINKFSDGTHPTQKPIEVCERAITHSSNKGHSVLDIFGGSGSTLIACEKTNRKCFMMELDPHYVDVIRKRYWKFINNGDDTGWEDATPVAV